MPLPYTLLLAWSIIGMVVVSMLDKKMRLQNKEYLFVGYVPAAAGLWWIIAGAVWPAFLIHYLVWGKQFPRHTIHP